MIQKQADEVLVDKNEIGVKKAEEEKYAFFMESVSIEYEVQRHCRLTQVGGLLDEKHYAIAMRKGMTFRKQNMLFLSELVLPVFDDVDANISKLTYTIPDWKILFFVFTLFGNLLFLALFLFFFYQKFLKILKLHDRFFFG